MKTKILLLALLSACSLSPATALASETVPQTQTALRSYFQTGHVPTQTNYWELIDTMFWYVASTYTNSLVTASNAAAELAVSPVAARVRVVITNTPPFITTSRMGGLTNIAVNTGTATGYLVDFTNYFSAPMADTAYTVQVLDSGGGGGICSGSFSVLTRATNCCVVRGTSNCSGGAWAYILFYR